MNQMSLITSMDLRQKSICLDNVHAVFTDNGDGGYDVVLEINSNKFLIAIHNIANQIDSFEIITTKGFVEMTNKIIRMIKKLVEHLRYRID